MTNKAENTEAESPFLKPLDQTMNVDFLFNSKGDVWIFHDRPLPDILKWVEYDADMESVTLITASGRMQDIGGKIPADLGRKMAGASEITVTYMNKGQVEDFAIVPMLVRGITIN